MKHRIMSRLFLAVLAIIIFPAGCRKVEQQPGEDAATFRKRTIGIQAARVSTGLDTSFEGVVVLVDGGIYQPAEAVSGLGVIERAAKGWQVVADRLEKGFTDNDTATKIQDIISDVESFEKVEVIKFKSDQAKSNFLAITGGLKITLESWKAYVLAKQGPQFKTEVAKNEESVTVKSRSAQNIAWVFNLSQVVLRGFQRASMQADLATAEAAYGDGRSIVAALLSKIQAKKAEYSTQQG